MVVYMYSRFEGLNKYIYIIYICDNMYVCIIMYIYIYRT